MLNDSDLHLSLSSQKARRSQDSSGAGDIYRVLPSCNKIHLLGDYRIGPCFLAEEKSNPWEKFIVSTWEDFMVPTWSLYLYIQK